MKKGRNDEKIIAMQQATFKDYYRPQEFVESPKYNAIWERSKEKYEGDRKLIGLNPTPIDINPEKLVDPTLTWRENPVPYSQSLLMETRKQDMLKDQSKFEKNFESHIDGQGRVEERENCIARLTFKGLDTVTYNNRMLKQRRIHEMIDDMTKKFGN